MASTTVTRSIAPATQATLSVPNRVLQSRDPDLRFSSNPVIPRAISGIPPPAHTFNPESLPDFAVKSRIPSFKLGKSRIPENLLGTLYICPRLCLSSLKTLHLAHNFYYVILANIFRFRFDYIPQLQQSLFIIGSIRIYSRVSLICRQTKVLNVRVTNSLRSQVSS